MIRIMRIYSDSGKYLHAMKRFEYVSQKQQQIEAIRFAAAHGVEHGMVMIFSGDFLVDKVTVII